jgi:glutaredoxin 3
MALVLRMPQSHFSRSSSPTEPDRSIMPKVEIYTTAICPYCVAAKTLLKQNGYGYEEIRVDTDPAKLAEMLARAQRRSVPQIFIDGHHIGGYDDLAAAARDGKLPRLGEAT